jgi:putative acetyltransferase
MRVADAFLGTGIGRRMLRHIIAEAESRGLASLWLETGSAPEFVPAVSLYRSEGFVPCPPFADYTDDPFSLYFTRALGSPAL